MSGVRRANRLVNETSPYLLQHAHNPVDWFPWGEEALAKAGAEEKPILLSIGYAACHWCHVMERESFEDEETAALMNERFVSIKVDREERPDLDAIYMDAVTGMTGHGGWPLTVFLTPEGEPFYGGTYFPKEERSGIPAFRAVLNAISVVWRDRREEARSAAERIRAALGRAGEMAASTGPLTEELSSEASRRLLATFDARWGGFGGAPKFPQPTTLEFLLRRHLRQRPGGASESGSKGGSDGSERSAALDMLTTTLDAMASGGIYDHVGGGFHRYSTDAAWHVPHFEKMLYDNAQLARLYVRAWQVTDRSAYVTVASETLDYLLREMQSPDGGFFSSQDADSEGVEGRYFAWSWDELVEAVGENVAICLGATPEGNWEGTNVLWRPLPVAAVAGEREVSAERLERDVEEGRRRLFELRAERVPPATDDKVLAGWNAMAISALAEAGRVFGSAECVQAAAGAAGFVLTHLRDERGRLLRSWRKGRSGGLAYADDHALMAEACLALYETTFELRWFTAARELCDELLRLFHDPERGGFFATGSDAEELLIRPKDLYDNAVPSGNSAAADVLLRMALLTGEAGYERGAVSALRLVRDAMAATPSGFGHALCALDLYLGPAQEVAIVGDPTATETRALIDEVLVKRFLPNHVLAVATPDDTEAMRAVPLLRNRDALGGRATAYVCERFACKAPVTDLNELAAQLV